MINDAVGLMLIAVAAAAAIATAIAAATTTALLQIDSGHLQFHFMINFSNLINEIMMSTRSQRGVCVPGTFHDNARSFDVCVLVMAVGCSIGRFNPINLVEKAKCFSI